jgi:catechol 2,3-dioxygenase-like lactoylglutathione lyase family enzyme
MIDHMTFRVTDLEKSKAFYAAVLAPLGYTSGTDFEHDGVCIVGFTKDGKPDTWLVSHVTPVTTGAHLAGSATSREQVDAFRR